jgi:hypothetical protein
MFKTLAKSRLANLAFGGFRPHEPRRIAPRGAGLSNVSHSNDNLPGFRRPKGQRRVPTPALACHWIERNGRLECRWQVEASGDAPIGDSDEHGVGRASGLSPVQSRSRGLALAG